MELSALNSAIEKQVELYKHVQQEFHKVIVGQDVMIESVMIGLLTGGTYSN